MRSPGARASLFSALLLAAGVSLLGLAPLEAQATGSREVAGWLVTVSVEVDGLPVALHRDAGGSGRYYLEAREGSEYAVTVSNRTTDRLGVSLVVDGLDAISGERRDGTVGRKDSRLGRLYVLEPWDTMSVRGWRTSLEDVRRFTFVDERASYAARAGKANARMGWIEVFVYRERERPPVVREPGRMTPDGEHSADASRERPSAAAPRAEGTPGVHGAPAAPAEGEAGALDHERRSYPGTGWGPRAEDPVVLVDFEPEGRPAERITLRYEYRDALIALGVIPHAWPAVDRLAERDRGERGFAEPPPR